MGVLYVEHANVLELCYIELLSGDGSPYSILSGKSSNSDLGMGVNHLTQIWSPKSILTFFVAAQGDRAAGKGKPSD